MKEPREASPAPRGHSASLKFLDPRKTRRVVSRWRAGQNTRLITMILRAEILVSTRGGFGDIPDSCGGEFRRYTVLGA